MATFIPGTRDNAKETRPSKAELFAIAGTLICTILSAGIMIYRLLEQP